MTKELPKKPKKKQAKMAAAAGAPACPNHFQVQHRDGRPPWCEVCGWNYGIPATPPSQVAVPRTSGTISDAPGTIRPVMGQVQR